MLREVGGGGMARISRYVVKYMFLLNFIVMC
jgi:hypothetical protein